MNISSMKAKIMETFKSIQGEGKYAGVEQVFVRFFECNMHCAWCDTPHSIGDTTRHFKEFSLDELFNEVNGLWDACHSVSITGGEPLIQADFIKELLVRLKSNGMISYLETNGVLPDELAKVIDDIDIIAMDIKMPSSTKCRAYWDEHKAFLTIARRKDVFVKTVVTSATSNEDLQRTIDVIGDVDRNILCILQPDYFGMKNGAVKRCQEFYKTCVKSLNNVRILPQTHKFMKLR